MLPAIACDANRGTCPIDVEKHSKLFGSRNTTPISQATVHNELSMKVPKDILGNTKHIIEGSVMAVNELS